MDTQIDISEFVRSMEDIVKKAHAAGQREGERKGIERVAKFLAQDDEYRELAKQVRNLEVGEE